MAPWQPASAHASACGCTHALTPCNLSAVSQPRKGHSLTAAAQCCASAVLSAGQPAHTDSSLPRCNSARLGCTSNSHSKPKGGRCHGPCVPVWAKPELSGSDGAGLPSLGLCSASLAAGTAFSKSQVRSKSKHLCAARTKLATHFVSHVASTMRDARREWS